MQGSRLGLFDAAQSPVTGGAESERDALSLTLSGASLLIPVASPPPVS